MASSGQMDAVKQCPMHKASNPKRQNPRPSGTLDGLEQSEVAHLVPRRVVPHIRRPGDGRVGYHQAVQPVLEGHSCDVALVGGRQVWGHLHQQRPPISPTLDLGLKMNASISRTLSMDLSTQGRPMVYRGRGELGFIADLVGMWTRAEGGF